MDEPRIVLVTPWFLFGFTSQFYLILEKWAAKYDGGVPPDCRAFTWLFFYVCFPQWKTPTPAEDENDK